ncbi:MAG TPA: thrombospondin type 3 repeat-containing protein [Bacteroidales bacterium]|nr:thrombospondin type 3 repeat-containing protein [Bacteroidales bacterium]
MGDNCDDDKDSDGILNDVDNCPVTANADQKDADLDGVGDVCDNDLDNDLVPDSKDNCPLKANADQADFDNDGIGDACEATSIVEAIDDGINLTYYPNPFNENTSIIVTTNYSTEIIIHIFDVFGNELEILSDESMYSGKHEFTWNAKNYSNGLYICTVFIKDKSNNLIHEKTIKLIKLR